MSSLTAEHSSSHFRVPRYMRQFFLVSILVTCFLALITTVAYFQLQPQIPLFYSLAEPNDYLAAKHWIFILPSFSAVVTFLHLLILPTLRNYNRVMNQLFGWLTLTIQVFCIIATLRIMMIVW
jgi:hypothetical protein